MDEFLATVGVQAMRYAIRSGIAVTSTYALGQCTRLLKSMDNRKLYAELRDVQRVLESKIKIITPVMDLIELRSGRGNVFLESALPLTKSLQRDIVTLGRDMERAAAVEEEMTSKGRHATKRSTEHDARLCQMISNMKNLLERIDREIPLLQLAITASGKSLSTSLPPGISPSRLLQASTLLTVGDTQYAQDPTRPVQIGPAFNLSMYMLFLGHASNGSDDNSREQQTSPTYGLGMQDRKPLWQEVMHKARVRLCRSPQIAFPSQVDNLEYSYYLEIIEDLEDGRVHDNCESAAPCGAVSKAGLRENIPIQQLSKIFYTDTGRILNLGKVEDGESTPVLLFKRDLTALRPQMIKDSICNVIPSNVEEDEDKESRENEQEIIDRQLEQELSPDSDILVKDQVREDITTSLPSHFDPEWMAFEVFDDHPETPDTETESGSESDHDDVPEKAQFSSSATARKRASLDGSVAVQIRNLSLGPNGSHDGSRPSSIQSLEGIDEVDEAGALDFVSRSPFKAITSSLSLVEMLIRLAGLQEFQQASHLSIPDHILTFFLEETSTTGLSGDARRTVRGEAKRRVGFDPYTDTPAE
ncbi:hypothetical protein HIM_04349 [Hirsutella minnesotensis 3608]|uniref:Ran-specific GTPase-activating protein 30 n=1 Tax=Hirsutella minnesotensis 3608 TaxID=1043627 RepID=A0A0F8A1J6_9HYPO|nr:hypothetical protein HIM_04349 [Hirsutella minnesotensis 3608]